MQPSSLIFLVIIAIWAAYLLQHWVRRHEHLATARSVDRFSAAMRVLERRNPLPESDLSAPQPRSYAVSPARASRSEVVVKRAQSPAPASTRPATTVRSTRVFHALAGMSARRVRGLTLLTSLSLTLVVLVLAAFSVLLWWSVPMVLAVLVADLAWLRRAAMAERGAGRATTRASRAAASPAGSASPHATRPAAPCAADTEIVLTAPIVGAVEVEVAELAVTAAVADSQGWAPVPVPPPTYTLKAKAEPPVRVSAATEPASGFEDLDGEGEHDQLLDRRRA